MKAIERHIIVFSLLLLPASSWATHPLITDDAETQGQGNFQLEVNGQYDYDKETVSGATVKTTGGQAASILSYGIVETADLILSLSYQWNTLEKDGITVSDEQGISDMTVEMKWRFFEREGLRLALKPGIRIPTGDEIKGLGNGRTAYAAFFILSRSLEPWDFHLNLGFRRNENTVDVNERKNIWHGSVAATFEVIKNLKAAANIGVERNTDKTSGRDPAFLLGGIIYLVGENVDLDFGVKKGLNEAETDYSVLAGTTLRF